MGTRYDAPLRPTDFRDRYRHRMCLCPRILTPADIDPAAVRP